MPNTKHPAGHELAQGLHHDIILSKAANVANVIYRKLCCNKWKISATVIGRTQAPSRDSTVSNGKRWLGCLPPMMMRRWSSGLFDRGASELRGRPHQWS